MKHIVRLSMWEKKINLGFEGFFLTKKNKIKILVFFLKKKNPNSKEKKNCKKTEVFFHMKGPIIVLVMIKVSWLFPDSQCIFYLKKNKFAFL